MTSKQADVQTFNSGGTKIVLYPCLILTTPAYTRLSSSAARVGTLSRGDVRDDTRSPGWKAERSSPTRLTPNQTICVGEIEQITRRLKVMSTHPRDKSPDSRYRGSVAFLASCQACKDAFDAPGSRAYAPRSPAAPVHPSKMVLAPRMVQSKD
ncbi:hypothetical protein PV10_02594 [Exophiala mesophila]|uniref:Uncharacterized protein n=1 Tax=Exophiala mesophila TaxID=212818 RepID=A0A0D2A797_EXOME|nr:uncharacterized protein PV10_02594 [Exophiala mesophila]KIV94873.1 hypothetical protein PV10_02594 [Exophiala mesophila]